jgi:hypothetical protein
MMIHNGFLECSIFRGTHLGLRRLRGRQKQTEERVATTYLFGEFDEDRTTEDTMSSIVISPQA